MLPCVIKTFISAKSTKGKHERQVEYFLRLAWDVIENQILSRVILILKHQLCTAALFNKVAIQLGGGKH